MNWFWHRKPIKTTPPVSCEQLVRDHLEIATALRLEGAKAERERIHGVYRNSYISLHPLIERFMFDGHTPPEAAALAVIALMQAEAQIIGEAARMALDDPAQLRRH